MSDIFIIRIILIAINLLLLGALCVVFVRAWLMRKKFTFQTTPTGKKTLVLRDAVFGERWREILKKAESGNPELMKQAVIDADTMVDETLMQLNLPGAHMADRMEQLYEYDLASLEGLWKAHAMRNDAANVSSPPVPREHLAQAMKHYEIFLNEIGAL